MKTLKKMFVFAVLFLSTSFAFAADAVTPKADEQPWTYKTQRLSRVQLDKLLGHPEKLLFIDVRRPDEVSKLGGFPIYLSVQAKNIEESLDYIPKGRTIVTVSNRAHRAGAVADFLGAHGYKVTGAVGTKDYEEQGGTVARIAVPAPKPEAAPAPAAAK